MQKHLSDSVYLAFNEKGVRNNLQYTFKSYKGSVHINSLRPSDAYMRQ